jgi:NTP pyrophosphatase (non-canonical NTP hydrolase)
VVQGNVFNRAFEEQLLAAMAERMAAETDELTQAVVSLEQTISSAAE